MIIKPKNRVVKVPQEKPQAELQLKRLIEDEEHYFEKCLKILPKKAKGVIPFILNNPQRQVKEILDKQERELGKIRAIILKARQEGVSTYVQGKFYHRCSTRRFVKALIVSHELDSAEHIFGMSRLFLQESPPEMVPMTRRTNRREILFENPDFDARKRNNPGLRSHIRVDTAGDIDVGASMTLHLVHLSEVARWNKAKETLTSLLQAVPDEEGTVVIFESTAMGVGNEFWDLYWKAKRGESEYIAIFLPWFLNPEYSKTIFPLEKFDWDDDEVILLSKFKLKPEQMKWRRWAIANLCGGDLEKFKQEYPSTDEEAFLTSGSRKYSLDLILNAEKSVIEPTEVGELDHSTCTFKTGRRGNLQLWSRPTSSRQYILAGDVGEGVSDADFSVATVWDHVLWEQVAMWRGRCSPEEFGIISYYLGRYYNNALVAPESNGIGLASCVILKNMGYSNLYYSRKKDEKTLERTKKLGFLTTSRTRGIGIGLLGRALREGDITIRAKEIIQELKTFIVKDNGRVEAEDKCRDDCVMSTIIFVSVATELPPADFEAEKKLQVYPNIYRGGQQWQGRNL